MKREVLQKLRQPGVKTGKGLQQPEIQIINRVLRNAAPANTSQADKALSRSLARCAPLDKERSQQRQASGGTLPQ